MNLGPITGWTHQRRDAYWQQGSICQDFSRIKIPVYAVSGWADNYSESVPRLMAGLTCPRLGLIGPWAHSFPHDVTVQPAIGWLQEALRWLDHWLKGQDTGIMDEPMLRVWMQDPVPPQTCYLERPGRWVGEPTWPSPHITNQTLPLNAAGHLGGTASQAPPKSAPRSGSASPLAKWAATARMPTGPVTSERMTQAPSSSPPRP